MKKIANFIFLVLQDRKKLFFSRTVMHIHLFVMFVYDMWQWESTEEIPKKKIASLFLAKIFTLFYLQT